MSSFKEAFGDGTILEGEDYGYWFALDAEVPIEKAVDRFSFEMGFPVTADDIKTEHVRFGYWSGRQCWHFYEYDGTRPGEKKIWIMEYPRPGNARETAWLEYWEKYQDEFANETGSLPIDNYQAMKSYRAGIDPKDAGRQDGNEVTGASV